MSNYKYYLKSLKQLSNEVVALELADSSGQSVFSFRPGQYVMIAYFSKNNQLTQRHAFSIVSSPSQNQSLILGIKLGGRFTKGLLNLQPGDPILVTGPFGNFVFSPHFHKDLVMIAGGIGVTPFLSTISYATDNNFDNKLTLIYSVRNLASANFYEQIKNLENKNSNFQAYLAVTNEKINSTNGKIFNQKIDQALIKSCLGDLSGKTFFICGPKIFMSAMKNHLLGLGVAPDKIEMEAFTMIDDEKMGRQIKNFIYALGVSVAALALIFYSIVQAALSKPVNKASNNTTTKNNNNNIKTITPVNNPAPSTATSIPNSAPTNNQPTNKPSNNYSSQPNKITNQPTVTVPQPTTGASTPSSGGFSDD